MLTNYLKIAWRNIRRQKGFAFINIAGLSVGIACCLLIFLYVRDELTYDRFHEHSDRIYRIVEERTSPAQGTGRFAWTAGPVAPTLAREFPEIQAATRFTKVYGRQTVQRGDARLYVDDYLFAEPTFFDVFSFELLRGDPKTALTAPNSVILTERTARTYFGEEEAIGKTLTVEYLGDLTVTGVLRDIPGNSHLDFSMLISMATLESKLVVWNLYIRDWTSSSGDFITYIVLDDPANAGSLSTALPALAHKHQDERAGYSFSLDGQRLGDIHFQSADIDDELNRAEGDFTYVYVFSAIGLFILLIACINYVNLATARSLRRAREVGLRRVVGAHRGQLVTQFLSESVLVVFAAFVLGVILCQIALPFFNTLTQKALSFDVTDNLRIAGALATAAILVGLLSGCYPALVLSRFMPSAVLKGIVSGPGGPSRFRSALVVTQFAISSVLVTATIVVQQQLHYLQSKSLGFDKEQLIVIDINNGDVRRNAETVKAELARIPGVLGVATSSRVPGDWKDVPELDAMPVSALEAGPSQVSFLGVDEDFVETYKLTILDGRNFEAERAADAGAVLLNETAARLFEWENPIGQRITMPGVDFSSDLVGVVQKGNFNAEVIGVVQDFHFRSLHEAIGPLIIGWRLSPVQPIDYFTARITGMDVPSVLMQIREIGERFDPTHPVEYNFLDRRLDQFYQTEARVRAVTRAGALVAVFIASLGLLGLATFTVERLTKEIGIRKVLGASISGVAVLVSRNFFTQALIGTIIATPIAYLVMSRWLEQFAFRIEIHWSLFMIVALMACALAVLTVSYHSVRAALMDPVKSLRYE